MLPNKTTTNFSELQIKQAEDAGILKTINSFKLLKLFFGVQVI
jgi:hypothetical protein